MIFILTILTLSAKSMLSALMLLFLSIIFLTQYQLHIYRSPLVPLRKILYLAAPDNYLGAATYYLPDAI